MQQRCVQSACCQLVRVQATARLQSWWPCHAKPYAPSTISQRRAFHGTSHRQQRIAPFRKELKDAGKAARASNRSTNEILRLWDNEEIDGWELTVGIEIHAQLNSIRKLFSPAWTNFKDEANSHLAEFDVALPGSQPIYQWATLVPALRAALALGCDIQQVSYFDRKHYFYHDQPNGYQITQYYHPYAKNGMITLDEKDGLKEGEKIEVGIKQLQMEQDTARTQEQDAETILVDFNRAGQPLIEIISLPHIHSPRVAAAYVRKVQSILVSVDAATTGMEFGGLRADVNVSVKRSGGIGEHSYAGVYGLGQRTEIKNLSTFKGVEDAIRAERARQINVLKRGRSIEGETRGWSLTEPHKTVRLRGKEGEVDYRYMPDPDIPPLRIGEDLVEYLRQNLPPTPDKMDDMLTKEYGLSAIDANDLRKLEDGRRLLYFQSVVDHMIKLAYSDTDKAALGKAAGNWVLHELGALLSTSDRTWTPGAVKAGKLADIIDLQRQGGLSNTAAKQILRMVFEGDARSVSRIVEEEGLTFVALTDTEYDKLVDVVISEYPEHVKDIQEKGKHGKIKFLLGQMMRDGDKGRIQATTAEEALRRRLLPDETP